MDTNALLNTLRDSELVLPRDLLNNMSERQLSKKLVEIYKDHRSELTTDERFQRNFVEAVNYLLIDSLQAKKGVTSYFDPQFISKLLALPDPA